MDPLPTNIDEEMSGSDDETLVFNDEMPVSDSSSSDDDMFIPHFIEVATSVLTALVEPPAHVRAKLTRKQKNRNRKAAHERLMADYFNDDCLYDDNIFRNRYRLTKNLFLRIATDLNAHYPCFQLRYDGRKRRGFTTYQKMTAALRQLALGVSPDSLDEYLKMSARVARESTYNFCEAVIQLYGPVYLRIPTKSDVEQLYAFHYEKHGFRGMLGSIDCTHIRWERCPNAWRGLYTRGDHGHPTIMLEAVVSQDLWFWHAYFGMPGSNNDINVLNSSPIFNKYLLGKAPECPFVVNGHNYKYGYYLADGIYPRYSTMVKAYQHPIEEDRKYFTKRQESARKDVERGFGAIKEKWHVLKYPARAWDDKKIQKVMYAVLILHNMMIEEKGRNICTYNPNDVLQPAATIQMGSDAYYNKMLELYDEDTYHRLRQDLTEDLWADAGGADDYNEPPHSTTSMIFIRVFWFVFI